MMDERRSFAEHMEAEDEAEGIAREARRNKPCAEAPRFKARECSVETESVGKDVCATCGKVWRY